MSIIETKIKNFLQANELIGKIDPIVPKILSNTLEIFLSDILNFARCLVKKLKKKNNSNKAFKICFKKKNQIWSVEPLTNLT